MPDLSVSEVMVFNSLGKLGVNKSEGPDSVHPRLLKECRKAFSYPLCMVLQLSLQNGELAHDWKTSYITLIHKKGQRDSAENYRPISVTSAVVKVLERFVNTSLIEHLEVNNILSISQHGFRSGRSVDTNLIQIYELVTTLLDKGLPVDMILLDLSKAFDKVCHEFLIIKLKAAGVNGVVQWIMGFLSERSQSVRVFDPQGTPHFSSPTTVLGGVPQGTILGPTLYNFYVNDLPTLLSNLIILYADDSELVGKAATTSDQQSIQTDLDNLGRWPNMSLLSFIVDK